MVKGKIKEEILLPKYNKLSIISKPFQKTIKNRVLKMITCRCECGVVKDFRLDAVKAFKIMSCGCMQKEWAKTGNVSRTHGLSNSTLYHVYHTMLQRCNYPKHIQYKDYGARGISVCKEWENDFMSFYNWAMDNGWEKGLTIDRYPNKNGNYEPKNCRLATMKEQNRNRNNNKINMEDADNIRKTYSKELKNSKILADMYGISTSLVRNIYNGKSWVI